MRYEFLMVTFILLSVFTACNNSKRKEKTPKESIEITQPIDTTKSFRIDGLWTTPKSNFEFSSWKENLDTLFLVTCSDFVYSPFGEMKEKTDLLKSNLKNFKIKDRIEKQENGEFEFQELTLKSSRLILFFDNDPEASRHSYIFKGEIFDKDVKFNQDIKIGMNKDNFIMTFFDRFPTKISTKYQCIVLESCVQDIKHIYSFRNNELESIKFSTDSYWTVNYEQKTTP